MTMIFSADAEKFKTETHCIKYVNSQRLPVTVYFALLSALAYCLLASLIFFNYLTDLFLAKSISRSALSSPVKLKL